MLAVCAVFARSAGFEFVRFDDPSYTFACPFVRGGLSASNVVAAFSSFAHGGIWMPATYVSYMLDVSLFGPGACGHHLVSVALHALNAVLLWKLLVELSLARTPRTRELAAPQTVAAVLAVAIWALHPLRVEPVCWIAARKELLWSAFALAGLFAWLRGRFGLGVLFCALACLSKPTAMCFPLLAWILERLANRTPRSSRRIVAYALSAAIAAATAIVAAYSQTHAVGYDARSLFTAPLGTRLAAAAHALAIYVGELALPVDLHADVRRLVPLPLADVRLWLGVALCSAGIAAAVRRRSGTALWTGLFFMAAIVPTLGVFGSFGREARADRFLYVPSMALSLFLVRIVADGGRGARLATWAAMPVAAAFAIGSVLAVPSWRNDYTLFSRVLQFDSEHPRALAHVASEECARFRNFDDGIAHFRKSLSLQYAPNVAAELAYALAARGRPEDVAEVRRLAEPVAADPRADRVGIARKALDLIANQ